jgi:dimethylamine monooxygenase subunit A
LTLGELPEHLPFDGDASRLRMGLRPLDRSDWVELGDRLSADLREKRRLLTDRHDEVVRFIDGDRARAASQELLDRLVTHLPARYPATYSVVDRSGVDRAMVIDGIDWTVPVGESVGDAPGVHPVEAAGCLTQEDWCVMAPDDTGRWRLVAASVCFPTRWVMPDKLGQDLWELHAPVAHYDAELGRPVDSFFDRLTPATGKWRTNWNVVDDPELFQPRSRGQFASTGPHAVEDVAELVWLRAERQTLVRLPETGAIVFGIRVHQDPLTSIADSPEVLERLASSLRSMRPDTWTYKSLDGYGHEVLAWIDHRLAMLV